MQLHPGRDRNIYTRPWMAPYQLEHIWSPKRYSIIEASTKSGKTAGCIVWLLEQAMAGQENWNYWWVAPVYRQALIAYRRMKRGLPDHVFTCNESENRITLANGAHIWFLSGEKPDNLYGDDVHAAVIDEASRLREESWYAIRSTLTATRGPVRIIGNVKGRGTWAYRLGQRAKYDERMHYAKITAHDAVDAGVLAAEEIEDARADLPEQKFRELYLAEPADIEGRIYKKFGPENVNGDIEDVGGDIYVGMDFNVDPMCCCLGSIVGNELHIWDEIVLPNSDTESICSEIKTRYPERQVMVRPDPSGKSRKSSARKGDTDFSIIRSYGFKLSAPNKAPEVADRINEVNAMICNMDGVRRLYVYPNCEHTIDSLESQRYKEGTSQPDKTGGFDHMNDALGYLVHVEFPIVPVAKPVKQKRLGGF